jgi:hypothetical protein
MACDLKLKGCITFRPNPAAGTLLNEDDARVEAPRCRVLERESDQEVAERGNGHLAVANSGKRRGA